MRTLFTMIEPGSSVLVVGVSAGAGIGTESMVESGLAKHADIVGLTYPPVSAPVLGAATVRGDARALPFVDNSFDYVVSNAVIEHVGGRDGARRMLLEGNRVARRGWIHTTPNRRFPIEVHTGVPVLHWLPRAARESAFSWIGIAFPEEHYHLFTARSLRRLGIPAVTRVASRVGVAMTLFIMSPELALRCGAARRSLRGRGTSAR